MDLIEEFPDIYLDEIVLKLIAEKNVCVSTTTVHNTLMRLRVTHKLLTKLAIERNEQKRLNWWLNVTENEMYAEQFIFVDESSKDERTAFRRYGRSFSGRRARKFAPFVRGTRYSILPALTVNG
jgi:hypothetical protein